MEEVTHVSLQGKADYLWVDKFVGSVQAWYNNGPADPASNQGSSMHWTGVGEVAFGGILRGGCINFGKYVTFLSLLLWYG